MLAGAFHAMFHAHAMGFQRHGGVGGFMCNSKSLCMGNDPRRAATRRHVAAELAAVDAER